MNKDVTEVPEGKISLLDSGSGSLQPYYNRVGWGLRCHFLSPV